MTEKELMQYKDLKQRLERSEKKLKEIEKKELPVVYGKVKGSSREFPFIETHYSVQMYEPKESDKRFAKAQELEKLIEADSKRVKSIESFINSIENPELQRLFELRVYERMGWMDIAAEMEERDRTTYSKRFKNYLINSRNSPDAQITIV